MNSFVTLLADSWKLALKLKVPIIIGALIIGAVMFVLQGAIERKIDFKLREGLLTLGIEDSVYQNFRERMEAGDDAAFSEMLDEMDRIAANIDSMPVEERDAFLEQHDRLITRSLLPYEFLLVVVSVLVAALSSLYFLILTVRKENDVISALKQVSGTVPSYLGVLVWSFVRSFGWIPLFGIIPAIYFAPRLCFSGVILLREKKSITECVKLSLERTKGRWWIVFANLIGVILCLFVTYIVVGFIASFTGLLAGFLMSIFSQLQVAFLSIFVVLLYDQLFSLKRLQR